MFFENKDISIHLNLYININNQILKSKLSTVFTNHTFFTTNLYLQIII